MGGSPFVRSRAEYHGRPAGGRTIDAPAFKTRARMSRRDRGARASVRLRRPGRISGWRRRPWEGVPIRGHGRLPAVPVLQRATRLGGVPDLRLQDAPVPARPKPADGPLGGEVAVEPPLGGAEGEVTRRRVVGLIPMPRPIRLTVPGCGAAWGDFSGAHLPGSRVVTQREGRRPVDAGGMTDVDGPGAGR